MSASPKFVNLRIRLDQLGFNQPFTQDSLELVDKLFKSFVKLSEVKPVVIGVPALKEADRSSFGANQILRSEGLPDRSGGFATAEREQPAA